MIALLAVPHISSCQAQTDSKQLKVTIVAVTEFRDDRLRDKQLLDSIRSARDGLRDFFVTNYKIVPEILTTADETKADFLRTWLFRDLVHDSTPAVHLVFFLTHGFAVENSDSSSFKNEIFLATSDTDSGSFYGTAIRGAELIEAFRNMSKRSIVFLFLDSCGSGAIDGDNLQIILQHEPDFATRLMILASAMRDESAYRARFSQTLLSIWQAPKPACHSGRREVEKLLTDSMKSIPGVSPAVEQNVRMVNPGAPDFCIESFNYTERLAFVFNAAPDDATLNVQASDSSSPEDLGYMRRGELRPILLRPKTYTMVAQRKSPDAANGSEVEMLDLKTAPVTIKVLFSTDPLDRAEADQNVADYLDSRDVLLKEADNLRESASAISAQVISDVEGRTKRLESEEFKISALIKDAQVKRSASQNTIAELQKERSTILARFPKDCATCMIQLTPDELAKVNDAKNRQQAAEVDLKVAQQQMKDAQRQGDRLGLARKSLGAMIVRAETLRTTVAAAQTKRVDDLRLLREIASQLAPTFANIKLKDTSIVVSLPDIEELNVKYAERFSQLVNVANKYSLLFELELVSHGTSDISEQAKARQRVDALLMKFQQSGLSTTATARAESRLTSDTAQDRNTEIYVTLSLQ